MVYKKFVWKFFCDVCMNFVCLNQKGIFCDGCNKWFYLKCIFMDFKIYIDLGFFDEQWFCDKNCGWFFNFIDFFFELFFLIEFGLNLSLFSIDVFVGCFFSGFFKCLLLNMRSVWNKIFDLEVLLLIDFFDIVVLIEIWFNNDIDDCEFYYEDYNIFC